MFASFTCNVEKKKKKKEKNKTQYTMENTT